FLVVQASSPARATEGTPTPSAQAAKMAARRAAVGRERELSVFDMSIKLLGFDLRLRCCARKASRLDAGYPLFILWRRAALSGLAGSLAGPLRHDELRELADFVVRQLLAELRHFRPFSEQIFGRRVADNPLDPRLRAVA